MRVWNSLEGSTPEKSVVVITIVPSRSGYTAPVRRYVAYRRGRDLRTIPLEARICTFMLTSGSSPSS
ncbi:hypothetical protein CP863_08650 [Cutibacterium acnes]|uniref:Uncharacterized protein n=1 Tax=Cutibacterium acnes TaxID=1747 RepID=A0AA44U4J4_CUTAC|nr:hypothetical protein HMPREF9577_02273 [Cutibacterium acnes HL110PA3]PEN29509.1 hypothetical protein APS59_04805 [Cutibacterium acnes]PGF27462.1 hypothetical protein B1B02_05875 [Cutibacterium acnes subsp. defendens]PGF34288.1 hypothetical protein B1B10_05020 [Cutibacterium acnes subsp. acnes]PGF28152.1 hypothetical protein B1B08_05865 [Cutibacterium acnes subsp. defendens]